MTDYLVFARKYRPQQFSDLMGQEALVKTLASAIEHDRMPHAIILTGVRGVGKTTTARLIARALNCVGSDGSGKPTVTPCGVCQPCRDILGDHHLDVIEMDAASRTGIDDIRTIIDATAYKPTSARYKVYIIDEVHMLSKSAFNALLKTLEEPPARVVFIFATTEIQKVPDTIISRCMRFDLKRIEIADLKNLFQTIAQKENFQIDAAALGTLAKCADGSARDGLSLLERARALSADGVITQDVVHDMLGIAENAQVLEIFKAIIDGQAAQALTAFRTFCQGGGNALSLLSTLGELIHHGSCALLDAQYLEATTLTPEDQQHLKTTIQDVNIPTLSRLWQVLLRGLQEIKGTPLVLEGGEMLLMRLCYLGSLPSTQEILASLGQAPVMVREPQQTIVTPPQTSSPVMDTPSPVPSTLSPVPDSFDGVVGLFDTYKEPLLKSTLISHVRLGSYDPQECSVTWSLDQGVAPDFIYKVQKCLNAWTGRTWSITESPQNADTALTIKEQKTQERAEIVETVKRHPVVQEVLQTFPDAEIHDIQPIKEAS